MAATTQVRLLVWTFLVPTLSCRDRRERRVYRARKRFGNPPAVWRTETAKHKWETFGFAGGVLIATTAEPSSRRNGQQ